MSKKSKHTIILVQFTAAKNTRQYNDFETVTEAMNGICKLFEQKLRMQHPQQRNFTYDIKDLYAYIDSLGDLGALVFDHNIGAYVPHNKDWIKERVFKHLKKIAAREQYGNPNPNQMQM